MKELQVYKLNSNATLPTRNKTNDAGVDLYALEDVFIPLYSTALVKTGVAINVPEGYVGKIEDRSSLASKGLRTGGGVVDAGYSGDVGIVIHNLTNRSSGFGEDKFGQIGIGYQIKAGDKIAQMLLYKVETPAVVETDRLWNSERGLYGFGSSGR